MESNIPVKSEMKQTVARGAGLFPLDVIEKHANRSEGGHNG